MILVRKTKTSSGTQVKSYETIINEEDFIDGQGKQKKKIIYCSDRVIVKKVKKTDKKKSVSVSGTNIVLPDKKEQLPSDSLTNPQVIAEIEPEKKNLLMN